MDVIDALENICSLDRLYKYSKVIVNIDFPPAETTDDCEGFMGVS